MIDDHYASLTSQGVQHGKFSHMVTYPVINPVQQSFTLVNRREPVFPFGATTLTRECLIFVSGGIASDWWCSCKVVRSSESGFHRTYDTELVVNIGSET